MAIDSSGTWWRGTEAGDLETYLVALTADDHAVGSTVHARCTSCGGSEFSLRVDPDEGCAERTCATCGHVTLMLDSEDSLEDADLSRIRCPCGSGTFNVGVGFAHRPDGDVGWVYVGIRCVADGILGACADWQIDYSPSAHLHDAV